jgi:hypothetical protein
VGTTKGNITENITRIQIAATARDRVPPGKKPPDIIYGVEDFPPAVVLAISGLQHVGLIAIFLIFPLLVVKELGAPAALSVNILSTAAIALGVAAVLQGLPKGPVGSGYCCPANYSAIYLAPSLAAAKLGGFPLLFGMTVFAGVVEAALSPILRRLRPLFPPELSGLVIFFAGTTVGSLGFRYLIGVGAERPVSRADIIVAAISLAVTAGLNVWGKGQSKLFCALIGMIVGYVAAVFTGVLSAEDFAAIRALPVLGFPSFAHLGWAFTPALALPFVVSALVATVKSAAVVTVCQRINDAIWVRPQMSSLSRNRRYQPRCRFCGGRNSDCAWLPADVDRLVCHDAASSHGSNASIRGLLHPGQRDSNHVVANVRRAADAGDRLGSLGWDHGRSRSLHGNRGAPYPCADCKLVACCRNDNRVAAQPAFSTGPAAAGNPYNRPR